MTENEILEGLIQNKRETYEYVYKTFGPPVLKYVLKNNGNREDAKDFFQEVLLKAVQQIRNDKYEQRGKFEAWFISIARNNWISYLRKTKPYLLGDDGFLLLPTDELDEDAILQLILHDNRLEYLNEIWKSEDWQGSICHKLLDLSYHQDKSYVEIAENMGYLKLDNNDPKEEKRATNLVGVKISRCKESLYKLLSQHYPQYFEPKSKPKTKP